MWNENKDKETKENVMGFVIWFKIMVQVIHSVILSNIATPQDQSAFIYKKRN